MNVLFFIAHIIESQILLQFLSALMITLMLCKDNINGQSFGKRIMKLQIVDEKTNKRVSNVRYIVRNFFAIFWIVEVFVLFISKDKRIGDYVAKTKVITKNKAEKIRFDKSNLISVLLCLCVIFILLFLVFNLFHPKTFQLLL
jgi:Predicted membrane protein/domain